MTILRILPLAAAIPFLGPAVASAASPAEIRIDATRRSHISPLIYGVNWPDWNQSTMKHPLARQGGNRMSAYNWETNASNAGADYHHQNDGYLGESNEPGLNTSRFFESARRNGATSAIVTIPMIGYVSADKSADGDVSRTPNYLETRFFRSLPHKPGPFTFPPDTSDRTVYEDEYVAWVEKHKGSLNVLYSLDNEPDIWAGTHARLVPKTPTYAQFIARSIEYAAAIKAVAPRAMVTGPVSYGWQGFRRFQDAADANNRDFLDVYLDAMKEAEHEKGRRLLDVLDIHFYPEARGDGVRITDESAKPGVALARIQAPRSLWDPTYVETSWITQTTGGRAIALLPGIQRQIATHYPGTKLAITEYHYGGRKDISGAIAQADVLGIYGRYGLYAACNWGYNPRDYGTEAGFRAVLNYDGKGGHFGDTGLRVQGETPAEDSVYAALDSRRPGLLTILAINKTTAPRPMRFSTAGYAARSCTAYVIAQGERFQTQQLPVAVEHGVALFALPPLSVTTLELRR